MEGASERWSSPGNGDRKASQRRVDDNPASRRVPLAKALPTTEPATRVTLRRGSARHARSASARPVTRAEDEAPTSCSPGEAPAKAARPERGGSSDSMGFTGADQASVVCWLRGETSCLGSRLRPCARASRAGTHGVDFAGGSPAYLWKGCWLRAPREKGAVFVGGRFGDWRRGRATMTK